MTAFPLLVHQVVMATAQELSTTPARLPLLAVLESGMTTTTCSATGSIAFLKEMVMTSVVRKPRLMVDRTYFTRWGRDPKAPIDSLLRTMHRAGAGEH